MRYIKAPFNFVPVSNQVYFPYWANQISHDIPFSDGLSGHLEIELKAETPIFIRDSRDEARFCHITDREGKIKFFIPGTSLKGTIRSVLEILSFAKMDKINDHKYAIRDLHNPGVYNLMKDSQNIRCGWLRLEKDENGKEAAHIRDCDTPWRISHAQLDAEFGTSFVDTFKEGGTADFSKDSNKTAAFKYSLLTPENNLTSKFKKTTNTFGKQLCDFDSSGQSGTLVFTGQPVARKTARKTTGKFYEFVFIEPTSPLEIKVDSKIWKEFKFHYFDDSKQISADWKWRKGQLKSGIEIPVFFRINAGDESKVKDLGLSYLYKMPYKYSVKDLLPEEHRLGFFKPDMAECLFGYTNDTDALKGRVQFSTAWADMDTVEEGDTVNTILGTPKASYYPIYIKQSGNNGSVNRNGNGRPNYKTYMDSDAVLAGRKRYPVREDVVENLPHGTENMNVPFKPLNKGAKFIAKINYFNLRPEELGVLLSALTFHNNASTCYHGFGMAKPFGFGRIALTITDWGKMEKEMSFYLTAFESVMNAYMRGYDPQFEWYTSDQIKEFIAMAKVQMILDNRRMEYMPLPEFAKAKSDERRRGVTETRGFYLETYSKIVNDEETIASFSDTEKVEAEAKRARILHDQLKEAIKKQEEKEMQRKKETENKKNAEKLRIAEAERLEELRKRERENQKEWGKIRLEKLKRDEILNEILKKKAEEEKKHIEARNEQLKKFGLEPVIREIKGFKKARKKIDQYLKQIGADRLDARDTLSLIKKALEWYVSTPDRLKGKRWTPPGGADWKKIASWIGDEPAKEWYKNLKGK